MLVYLYKILIIFFCGRVHVRRTDKVGTEAAFHSIDEYMFHVADYFNKLDMKQKVEVRRVYLASDDPSVIPEAKKKWVIFFNLRVFGICIRLYF